MTIHFIFLCLIGTVFGEIVTQTPIQVTTSLGTLIGLHYDQGNDTTQLFYGQADMFLGVPFAQPPIGPLRFRKPQPITAFPQNPYNASYNRMECSQPNYDETIMSEDCLYLYIMSPNVKSTTKYAVMVWIHGGGFLRGNGQPYVPGAVRNIVMRDIVLVLIQYRLGIFGFFTTFTDDFPPNLGLLDQIEAFKFVQQQIGNFAGDPTKVTIFGESAGSASVNAHTFSPLSQGLFQQAIMESGTAHLCFEDALGPTYQNFRLVSRACGFTFDMWNSGNFSVVKDCLMNMDPDHAIGFMMAADGNVPNALCYNMVQDNNFFPGTPRDLAKNRKNIPTIIGSNKDEWATFELIYIMNSPTHLTTYTKEFAEFRLAEVFAPFYGRYTQEVLTLLENLYLPSNITDSDNLEWLNFVIQVGTTNFWSGPVGRDVQLNIQNNNPDVYVYEFTYYSGADSHNNFPGWKPVTHGAETSFLFMGWGTGDLANHRINISDVNIADFFGESWTNFAKTGKPTTDGSWKAVTSAINNTAYWEIGWDAGMRPAYRNLDQIQYNEILPSILGTETPRNLPEFNNGSQIGCPLTFTQGTINPHHCYGIFNMSMNQTQAITYCSTHFTASKTSLKTIDNAFENTELFNYLQKDPSMKNCPKPYIGLFQHGGGWRWASGNGNYSNWDTGFPINNSDYKCVVVNAANGKFQNQDCNIPECFVCETAFPPGVGVDTQPPPVYIATSRGTAIGYHFDQGNDTTQLFYGQADVFLSIPFAEPPVGPLRFAKPQKLAKFPQEPYYASYSRLECSQPNYNGRIMGEDCLYLNILTPSANSTTKYPVMVWIHGGGFLRGSAVPSIPGTVRNFNSRGVVVVFIQYRLGIFGFFTTHTDDFPPNLGLLDQIEALKFIQEEISNFGGDPTSVTIFGESAGSASVNAHTFSPLSQGLFHKAIMESGTAHLCFDDALGSTYQSIRIAERACNFTWDNWNAGNFAPLKSCLQNMDVKDAIGFMMGADGPVQNALCFNMVQDDNFFPGTPRSLAAQRKNIPTIIGTNKDEWATFEIIFITHSPTNLTNYTRAFAEERLRTMFSNFLGGQTQDVLTILENMYLPNAADDDHLAWLNFVDNIGTSFFWTGPVGRDVQLNLQNNNPDVYVYEFTYYSGADSHNTVPGWTPVTHGAETSFVFMGWDPSDFGDGKINISDVNIATFFGEAWTNFAKTGKPTTDGSWKPVTSAINNTAYWEIGWNSGLRTAYRNFDQIQFNEIIPNLIGGETPRDIPDFNNGSITKCLPTFVQGTINPKHCYTTFNTTKNQTDANYYCSHYFIVPFKTTLKNIDNGLENSELSNYLNSNAQAKTCTKSYIGLNLHNGQWIWENGNGTYFNWDSGFPSNDPTATCTVFVHSSGKWQNQACNIPECYICESTL